MEKKIKIMFVTGALSYGGLERVVINLCTKINRNIFEPIVVCLKNRGELAEEVEACKIKLINLNANQSKMTKYMLWRYLRQIAKIENVVLIHSHNTAAFIDCAISTIGSDIKLVHTDHNRLFPDKFRYMFAENMAARRANKIIAVSDELKKNLVRYEKISADKIQVIQNGIDGKLYNSNRIIFDDKTCHFRKKFKFVIGLAVTLRKEKGVIHLIEAAPQILKKFSDTGFFIGGDGPVRRELEVKVDSLGLTDNFIFPGFRRDIPALLNLFDIYVFPSEWEGLPLSILEAMAAKRCILSTAVGGIPTALKNNENAILVKPKQPDLIAKKIIYLLQNESLRQRLADAAYQTFLEKFDVRTMISQYEHVYLEALGYDG